MWGGWELQAIVLPKAVLSFFLSKQCRCDGEKTSTFHKLFSCMAQMPPPHKIMIKGIKNLHIFLTCKNTYLRHESWTERNWLNSIIYIGFRLNQVFKKEQKHDFGSARKIYAVLSVKMIHLDLISENHWNNFSPKEF